MPSEATPRARTGTWCTGRVVIPVRTTTRTSKSPYVSLCFGLATVKVECISTVAHGDLVVSDGSIYFHNPDQSTYYWSAEKGYSRYVSPDGNWVTENGNPNLQGVSVPASVRLLN